MTTTATTAPPVLDEILAERLRQDAKWGEQNHPDGTGPAVVWGWAAQAVTVSEIAREQCQHAFAAGEGTWRHILAEEVAEAYAEADPAALRAELIQTAAVCVAWIEAIDRRL